MNKKLPKVRLANILNSIHAKVEVKTGVTNKILRGTAILAKDVNKLGYTDP